MQVVTDTTRDSQFAIGLKLLYLQYHLLRIVNRVSRLIRFKIFLLQVHGKQRQILLILQVIQMIVMMTILDEEALVKVMGTTIEEAEVNSIRVWVVVM